MAVRTDTAASLVEEVFRFGRALRVAVARSDDRLELAPALVGVLGTLATHGECRQSELAVVMCTSQSVLSRQLAELTDAGHVVRTPDPADGRATRVRVSDQGIACLDRIKAQRVQRLSELLADWDEDEAHAALESITRLTTTFTVDAQTRHSGSRVLAGN
ncbi:MarR family winged helix-turn-helix transcriptional regulator [Rhodococcoides corynebacterioides]|uniref:MarR family winged helix-turn-helix transcriptional regulator n=1 Tax=Rhodococcoides corynebacterioides TaxID=53972 RepID=UPI0008343C34|nr:MarR family transcriptional regulator [Rhodococcus corynebacterioides]MBY6350978.1 MarR family transcriptional regulator [Rhodococcus corynebacterioides]MBY6364589.1 MarR family transcriptional regulator [Rhodococcus corynebacterioides]